MKKLLVINNIPTPYREYMFKKFYNIGLEFQVEVTVAFQAKAEPGRPWHMEDFKLDFPYYISKKLFSKS